MKEFRYNGVLFRYFRYLKCYLFYGHDYKQISPSYQGRACFRCSKCGYENVQ